MKIHLFLLFSTLSLVKGHFVENERYQDHSGQELSLKVNLRGDNCYCFIRDTEMDKADFGSENPVGHNDFGGNSHHGHGFGHDSESDEMSSMSSMSSNYDRERFQNPHLNPANLMTPLSLLHQESENSDPFGSQSSTPTFYGAGVPVFGGGENSEHDGQFDTQRPSGFHHPTNRYGGRII